MSLSTNDVTSLVIVALFVVIVGRRIVWMVRGAPVRPERMFAVAGLYTAIFVLVIATSLSQLPLWSYAVDGAVAVVAAIGATIVVQERVVIEWRNDRWYYRLGVAIPVLYLVLFVARLALDFVVLGVDPFAFASPSTAPLSGIDLVTVAVVDALFAFSTGLLVGRTTGVYLEYRKKVAAGPPTPAAPPLPPSA
ncbi:MAG: hypothetical protein L3K00_01915 [Thermoplasmata archaeon]|nr:hypothetical protein [Thermoplasmata archaeon]MCI4362572.1 hypothetical protein [Thermoplasmata archaeon]